MQKQKVQKKEKKEKPKIKKTRNTYMSTMMGALADALPGLDHRRGAALTLPGSNAQLQDLPGMSFDASKSEFKLKRIDSVRITVIGSQLPDASSSSLLGSSFSDLQTEHDMVTLPGCIGLASVTSMKQLLVKVLTMCIADGCLGTGVALKEALEEYKVGVMGTDMVLPDKEGLPIHWLDEFLKRALACDIRSATEFAARQDLVLTADGCLELLVFHRRHNDGLRSRNGTVLQELLEMEIQSRTVVDSSVKRSTSRRQAVVSPKFTPSLAVIEGDIGAGKTHVLQTFTWFVMNLNRRCKAETKEEHTESTDGMHTSAVDR